MKTKLSTLLLASACSFCTFAQAEVPDSANLKNIYDTSRSMSGLITYCVDKGLLKASSLDDAKKMVAYVENMPAEFDKSAGDEMEKNGRLGKISTSDGTLTRIETAPQGLEAWCKGADEGLRQGLESFGQ